MCVTMETSRIIGVYWGEKVENPRNSHAYIPLRIYTSCITHRVDNNIIHIRRCGKTFLLLSWVTYMTILPASHPTVYIYAESYVYVLQIYVIYRRYWIRIDTIYNTWIGYIDSININIYMNCLSYHMWITFHVLYHSAIRGRK